MNSYVYLAVFLSLAAFLVLLAVGNAAFLQSLFTMDMNVYRSIDYRMLSITAGVILVSGMVHTEYTIPGIQFASYGMLIAASVMWIAGRIVAVVRLHCGGIGIQNLIRGYLGQRDTLRDRRSVPLSIFVYSFVEVW